MGNGKKCADRYQEKIKLSEIPAYGVQGSVAHRHSCGDSFRHLSIQCKDHKLTLLEHGIDEFRKTTSINVLPALLSKWNNHNQNSVQRQYTYVYETGERKSDIFMFSLYIHTDIMMDWRDFCLTYQSNFYVLSPLQTQYTEKNNI